MAGLGDLKCPFQSKWFYGSRVITNLWFNSFFADWSTVPDVQPMCQMGEGWGWLEWMAKAEGTHFAMLPGSSWLSC